MNKWTKINQPVYVWGILYGFILFFGIFGIFLFSYLAMYPGTSEGFLGAYGFASVYLILFFGVSVFIYRRYNIFTAIIFIAISLLAPFALSLFVIWWVGALVGSLGPG